MQPTVVQAAIHGSRAGQRSALRPVVFLLFSSLYFFLFFFLPLLFFFFAGGPPVWRSLVLAPFVSQSSGSYQVNRSLNRLVNTCVRFSDSSSLSLGGLHLFVGQLLVAKKKRETIERDRRNNRQRKAKVRKYLYDV